MSDRCKYIRWEGRAWTIKYKKIWMMWAMWLKKKKIAKVHHLVSVSCTPWELARVHVNCACGRSFCLSARGRTRMTSCVGRRPRPRASWEWHPAPTTQTSAAQAAWVHPPSPSRDRSSSSPWSVQFWWTILVLIQTLSPEACEEQTPLETVRSDLFFPQSRALWLPSWDSSPDDSLYF